MRVMISRFAPAPTGYLHLGHVLNAEYVWAHRRAAADRVLLRIEDHDRQRSRAEYDAAILEDLEWLGFEWDGPVVRQSERGDIYIQALERLRAQGLVYACACSRADIAADFTAGRTEAPSARAPYPGTCRDRGLADGPGMTLRVRVEAAVERFVDLRLGPQEQRPGRQCGDFAIRDREGNWTYQFAVTVDDLDQQVTHVIRGEDLLESTGRQIQLARRLGRSEPPAFLHHPLIMTGPGRKLSKSDGDSGVRDLRARGWSPQEVRELASSSIISP